jgi:ATP phosphoribosyltransferase
MKLTLALSKGRIFEETADILSKVGIVPLEDPEKSRKLIIETTNPDVRLIIVRASDVPTYVQFGGADFGVAGLDVLMEKGTDGLYVPYDLNIAKCRMSVAVREGFDYSAAVKQGSRLKVATKYVNCARDHFANKGVVGLADAIVDLVSTGNTLKANGLVEVEPIADISARLVVNQASFKRKRAQLQPIFELLK